LNDNKKIKLLIVTPSLECGGAEQYVVNVCNNINKNDFDVTLLVVNNGNPFYTIENDINIVDLKKKKASLAILKILQFVKKNNFDIVYSTANHLNLLLAIFKNFIPKTTKLIAWETSIVSINHKHASYPKMYNFLLKIFYKKLPLVICQSNYMQQDLIEHYGFTSNQLPVIYTGISKLSFEVNTSKNSTPVFLTVSRLSPEKGINKIIEALSLLEFDFKYIIIGEGIERKKLEKQIDEYQLKNKVCLMGQLTNPYKYIKQANLFLMASKYEGLPTTLIEATALGIPVIAYNTPGGISEIIQDGVNGFLVNENNNNNEAFANTIKKALDYPFNKELIIYNTMQRFNITNNIMQLQDIFAITASV
jgi:glycosyltransferase involved in cell wall biosynthesis